MTSHSFFQPELPHLGVIHGMASHAVPPTRLENPSLISHLSDQTGAKFSLGFFFQPELPHLGVIRGVISLNSLILA